MWINGIYVSLSILINNFDVALNISIKYFYAYLSTSINDLGRGGEEGVTLSISINKHY